MRSAVYSGAHASPAVDEHAGCQMNGGLQRRGRDSLLTATDSSARRRWRTDCESGARCLTRRCLRPSSMWCLKALRAGLRHGLVRQTSAGLPRSAGRDALTGPLKNLTHLYDFGPVKASRKPSICLRAHSGDARARCDASGETFTAGEMPRVPLRILLCRSVGLSSVAGREGVESGRLVPADVRSLRRCLVDEQWRFRVSRCS